MSDCWQLEEAKNKAFKELKRNFKQIKNFTEAQEAAKKITKEVGKEFVLDEIRENELYFETEEEAVELFKLKFSRKIGAESHKIKIKGGKKIDIFKKKIKNLNKEEKDAITVKVLLKENDWGQTALARICQAGTLSELIEQFKNRGDGKNELNNLLSEETLWHEDEGKTSILEWIASGGCLKDLEETLKEENKEDLITWEEGTEASKIIMAAGKARRIKDLPERLLTRKNLLAEIVEKKGFGKKEDRTIVAHTVLMNGEGEWIKNALNEEDWVQERALGIGSLLLSAVRGKCIPSLGLEKWKLRKLVGKSGVVNRACFWGRKNNNMLKGSQKDTENAKLEILAKKLLELENIKREEGI